MSSPEHHSVVVVGGGVAGLHTALRLIEAGITDVRLYEGRGGLGGRVKTTRDAQGNARYNDFAWRVGEGNTRMLALATELGVEMRKQFSSDEAPTGSHSDTPHGSCDAPAERPTPANRAPLSVFAAHSLTNTATADRVDRESGYAGRTAQVAFPGESHGSTNYIPTKGMNEFALAISAKLPEGVVNLHHRVKDVHKTEAGYTVEIVVRDGNVYSEIVVSADTVVLAAPPVSLRRFSVAKQGLDPVLFAVHQRRLCHAYVKCKGEW